MARKSNRKLFLFGRYSLALLLPKRWLTELAVGAGDRVGLELDRARKRIIVRLKSADEEKGNKSKNGKNNKKKTDQSSEWEPIPQL